MFRRVTRNPVIGTLLFVILVAAALVNLVPFVWMVSTSLKPLSKVFAYPPEWIPNPIKWSNYPNALHVINPRVFLNSLIVTCSIVLIQGLVTTMGGFAFARLRFPFRDQIFLLYLGTILIPSQVTLIPSYIVIVHLGWVNTYQGIVAPVIAHGAFGTFLFRQFFLRIPDEYYEAARLDGANYWQQFWRLTLPLSRPVLSAYGILTFLNAWKLYLWPLIVVRSPDMKVLPMAIAELSGTAGEDRAVMMAAVALSILPLLVLWIIAQKWIIQGIASSGLKG
jgi:multiple sugar transport system permease protein